MSKLSHTLEFQIPTYGADFNGKATIQTLLQCFQEVAWQHAEILDLGFDKLFEQKLIWVLARQRVKIYDFPTWRDKIKVKTWAVGRDKLFWYRDFRITDQNDIELAKAASSWIIINYETRRPFIADESFTIDITNPERAFEEPLSKIRPLEYSVQDFQKNITYSDLDLNEHVNNVKYIEWILDGYDFGYLKEHKIETVELNYLAEAKVGDSIKTCSQKSKNDHLHNILRESDGKELFRSNIIWKKD